MASNQIVSLSDQAPVYELEGPQPLYREVEEGRTFPIDALGPILKGAVLAIHDKVQAPIALGAQSILAGASIVAQGHVNTKMPTGAEKPCSLFLLTIGESGERKSTCDHLAMQPLKSFERSLRSEYGYEYAAWRNKQDAWDKQRNQILSHKDKKYEGKPKQEQEIKERALDELGLPPEKPLEPILTCEEPTYAALCKTLETGLPSVGIFSDEGGEFIGGHAMKEDNKLRTSAGLSKAWDGTELKRIRAGDGNSYIYGKRVAMHLMVQPEIAYRFLSDPLMFSQGLLSRFLVTYPSSNMGNRPWKKASPESELALKCYQDRMDFLLKTSFPTMSGNKGELDPKPITFTKKSEKLWVEFYNSVENQLGKYGELRSISGFANKLCDNVARLATILAFFEEPDLKELPPNYMASGIELAQYYLEEALRLFMVENIDPSLQQANVLLEWLQNNWKEPNISVPDAVKYGPNQLRDTRKVEDVMAVLENNGWLVPLGEPALIKGNRRRNAWKIIKRTSNVS